MKGREVVALALVVVLLAAGHLGRVECQLTSTFYATSCPSAGQIVRDSVGAAVNSSQIVGPSVLRLFAHDCFIEGCDGSILLEDTSSALQVERDASDNLSLQQLAFDAINQAKVAVEAQCPGIVSCTDVLVMASEVVVNMMGGPSWTVLLGRRDGLNSSKSGVAGHLPGADMDVNQLMGIFGSIGLSKQDLVTLSGAHTVGFAHCNEFTSRLYNFNNVSGTSDPSLARTYLATLQGLCPNGNFSNSTAQALDPTTTGTFDNSYYQQLQIGQGLLFSDQVIFVDNTTTNLVTTYANNQAQFFTDFVTSMIAMSQVGVLTGSQGEIRLNCSVVNSGNSVPTNSSAAAPSNSTAPPSNSTTPPSNSTTPPSNSTTPAPVPPTPAPVVTPSPPPPVVTPPVLTPSPPPPVVTPSPPPAVTASPPPLVTASPPPPVTASPPPAVTASPPPAVAASPPPAVTASPPPPSTASSPPPVTASPPPPVTVSPPPSPAVTPSPPPVVTPPPPVTLSPPPALVTPASPPPVPKVAPSPPPPPGGRRRF